MLRENACAWVCICSCRGKSLFSDSTELLMEPLQLVRGNKLFKQEFVNILHALPVFSLLLIHDNLNQYSVSTQIQSLLHLSEVPVLYCI
jgi:hypothetical protein